MNEKKIYTRFGKFFILKEKKKNTRVFFALLRSFEISETN